MRRLVNFYRGIGLLELMLSLAIIAILLIMATRYYQITRATQQLNDSMQTVQAVRAAGERWLLSHDDYAKISINNLIQRNLLPSNFGTNPWGGEVAVQPADNNGKIKIILKNIPVSACQNLQLRLSTGTSMPGSCTPGPGNNTNYEGIF